MPSRSQRHALSPGTSVVHVLPGGTHASQVNTVEVVKDAPNGLVRRKRNSAVELAPSSTGGYTNTGSRYSPDNSSADISDMKATYVEELSPNVSSSDIHPQEVLVPMDGHLTIVGSYEEFLDVPTGARPNLLQCLPVSPTMHTETVTRTVEMTDPELAFSPSERQT